MKIYIMNNWWNFEDDQLKNVERMFYDVDEFIKEFDK